MTHGSSRRPIAQRHNPKEGSQVTKKAKWLPAWEWR